MGECIQEQVLALWPKNLVGSVLLLNTYATAGNWDLCESVELQRIWNRCEENRWIQSQLDLSV